MEDHRKKAIGLGLTDIDNNLSKYGNATPQEQRDLLDIALAGHQLRYRDMTNSQRRIDSVRLRDYLFNLAGKYKRQADYSANDIFKLGSDMLTPAQLNHLNYKKQVPTKSAEPASTRRSDPAEGGARSEQSGPQQQDGPSPDYSPLSSVDEDVLRRGAGADGPVQALHLAGRTNSQIPTESPATAAYDTESTTEDSAKATLNKVPDSSRKVETPAIAAGRVGTLRAETPSGTDRISSMPPRTLSVPPGRGSLPSPPSRKNALAPKPSLLGKTAPAPKNQQGQMTAMPVPPLKEVIPTPTTSSPQSSVPQPRTSVSGKKRLASGNDLPTTSPQKRQKPTAPPLHPREITGMPAPLPLTRAIEGPFNLASGMPRLPHLITYLNSPSNHSIHSRLERMRTKIGKTTAEYCRGCPGDAHGKPAVVPNPSERLKKLYEIIFGQNAAGSWKNGAKHIYNEWYGNRGILDAVIGAAVFDMVFTKPVPWGTPWDEIERFRASGHAPYFKEAARLAGWKDVSQDFLILRAAELQIDDTQFQNSTIRPIAKDLAEELEVFIRPQLDVLGFRRPEDTAELPYWNEQSAGLTDIFTEALIARGQMDVAPAEFRYTWIPSGRKFDDDIMIHEPKTSGVTSLSTSPLVDCKVRPEDDWHIVAKASGFLSILVHRE